MVENNLKISFHKPIYPADLLHFLRKSERSVQRMFQEVRDALGKKDIITLNEFCEYHLLSEDLKNEIAEILR